MSVHTSTRPNRSAPTPEGPGSDPAPQAQRRSETIKLRRAVLGVLMTLVLPGSVQLATGHQGVGRLALRVWAVLVGLTALTVAIVVVWRSAAIALAANQIVMAGVQITLVLLGIAWAALIVDAWRLGRPPELARAHRLGFAIVSFGLAVLLFGGGLAGSIVVADQRELVSAVFAGGGDTHVDKGRYNILLLGGDAGVDRTGVRPDSITVASVDAETGRSVLFGLPRNLEDVPFPESSPMHREFPNGFTCPDHACLLNAVYTYATEHRDLYPGVHDPGAQATKEAVEAVTGLKINYYAMIEIRSFEKLIDAVGGITLDIGVRVPIGGGGSPVRGYIEPGTNVHLDGYHALWFARSRHGDSDYARMARQKCVMRAMLNQLDPITVMTQFNTIAAAGKEVVATDVPTSDANNLVDLALAARSKPISSVSFTPPAIYPGSPDFAKIKTMVQAKIDAAEAADQPKPTSAAAPTTGSDSTIPTPSSSSKASAGSSGSSKGSSGSSKGSSGSSKASSGSTAVPDEDLDSVCTVS